MNGEIWILRDDNHDNVADSVTEFATWEKLTKPEGMVWSKDGLYVNRGGALILMNDTNGDGKADKTKILVDGFAYESYAFHQNNGLTFGPGGRLYIGSGATTIIALKPIPSRHGSSRSIQMVRISRLSPPACATLMA